VCGPLRAAYSSGLVHAWTHSGLSARESRTRAIPRGERLANTSKTAHALAGALEGLEATLALAAPKSPKN
jgi:hypothetical protein